MVLRGNRPVHEPDKTLKCTPGRTPCAAWAQQLLKNRTNRWRPSIEHSFDGDLLVMRTVVVPDGPWLGLVRLLPTQRNRSGPTTRGSWDSTATSSRSSNGSATAAISHPALSLTARAADTCACSHNGGTIRTGPLRASRPAWNPSLPTGLRSTRAIASAVSSRFSPGSPKYATSTW